MCQLKSYKLYAFTNDDIESDKIVTDSAVELKAREVRLTENIMIKAFKRYKNEKFNDNEVDTDLIKVMLSNNFDTAMKQCKSLQLKNKEYTAWFATPSMMKKEDKDSNSKCEMYFINQEYEDFAAEFEYLISLGKIEDYYGTDQVINKELSRIALAISSSYETNLTPNIIILPECEYKIISDIVTIQDDEVVTKKDYPIKSTIFDGCGVMSIDFAKQIQRELRAEHDISLAGIRMYNGLAIKGLVTSIDFNQYFNEFYTHDTDYFKKENNKFYIKDMYGDWQCTEDVDMILNESQCKWAKNFDSMTEIEELLSNDEFREYKDLLSHLYITKINKADNEIKEYTRSNYQLLANLAITEKEIDKLSAETERIYREIINGNEDIIRIYWGDIIQEIDTEDMSMSTKAQELLTFNPDFIKLGYVKRAIGRVITKKIEELAAGKFYIRGDYKTLTQDPISYLDWIMNRTDDTLTKCKNGLKANEFYCSSIKKGEIRTISRNPLNSFSEILNVEHDTNDVIDKYIGHYSKEIYVFNAYDLTPHVLSGCDFDLDIAFIVDEEIIRNSVIEDLPFVNLDDVEQEENKGNMKFTPYNRLYATLKASGNLIGSLALSGAGVSNYATNAGYKMYEYDGTTIDYDSLLERYFNSDKVPERHKNWDKFQEVLSRFTYTEDYYTEEELKEQIREGLYYYRKESYQLRNLQMVAIDAPKTLILPKIPQELRFKRPRYLKYIKKDYLNNKNTKNITNALNIHATRIAHELLRDDIKLIKSSDNKRLIKKYLANPDFAAENKREYEECKEIITKLYEKYKEKKMINKKFNDALIQISDEQKKNKVKKARLKKMLEIEAAVMIIADVIIEKYDDKLISHALAMLECSESFIFNFFYSTVATVLKEKSKHCNRVSYIESEDGDINYLHKRYKKVVINNTDNIEELHRENREKTKEKLAKLDDSFEHQVRVCITNKDIDEIPERATIKTQLYRNVVQPVLDNIGFVYQEFNAIDDYRELTDFEDVEVNISVIDKKNNNATLVLSV